MITLANIKRSIYNICKRLDMLEASAGTNPGGGGSSGGGFSGDYNDLRNKPTIPAAQIQSDWNQTNNESVDFIKNKPTIPAAQIQSDWNQSDNSRLDFIKNKPSLFSGDYNDLKNKPTIPSNETATSGGTTLSIVTTGDKYNWNNKANIWRGTQAEYDLLTPDNNTIYIIIPTSE